MRRKLFLFLKVFIIGVLFLQVYSLAYGAPTKTGRDGLEMVLIPAGEFLMGSPNGEGTVAEHPQHAVYLDKFYIDKYEVTVAQYKKFCKSLFLGDRVLPAQPEWSTENSPVVNVSWEEAAAYANYYGKQLPTEAQWEKACRAGTQTKYAFGDKLDATMAKFNTPKGAAPVGSYKPNAYGVYDMHGNAWEWCEDRCGEDYYSVSPKKNPQGPKIGPTRILRGGGWAYEADACRSANRLWSGQRSRNIYIGFRCVPGSRLGNFWRFGILGSVPTIVWFILLAGIFVVWIRAMKKNKVKKKKK